MHRSILKLVYIHVDILHVLANHVAIFTEGKYKRMYTLKGIYYKMKFRKYQRQSPDSSGLVLILK